ncbi:MAG: UDP-N-acetylglucosamine 1-carboxyvinyltransferase [Deltaproteobacteria bacterium]|nr:UDP-N-acetylglucosamine 1-carboxyvinyltransferase [Deltaproteobacteria bacterium]
MDKLIIEGGYPLHGFVKISGAKNAALPLMAASLLADGPLVLTNLPHLGDLKTMGKLLSHMGGTVTTSWESKNFNEEAILTMGGVNRPEAPHDLVKTMRASALVLGPLLTKFGKAVVSLPGGCAIGVRPIDMHLKALKEMGADFDLSGGDIIATTPPGGLKGASITFETITVTGTENIMMAAVLAQGVTTIANAAREPEVLDTGKALISMGAKIEGLGTDEIIITGVSSLKGTSYSVMPDRIECGTLIASVALAGGEITILGAPIFAIKAVQEKFGETGLSITQDGDNLVVKKTDERLKSTDITTLPHPGFPTDMQAQFMAAMALAEGVAIITETIFENRFMHVSELKRLGADISLEGRTAVVKGVPKLSGAPLTASDLRASASLLLAALAAQGTSSISRVYHLDRGYDRLDIKLNKLGAKITRTQE